MARPRRYELLTMAAVNKDIVSFTSEAPLEPKQTSEHEFDDVLLYTVEGVDGFSDEASLGTLIANEIEGCGATDLVKLEVAYVFTGSGQSIWFGVCDVGASLSATAVAAGPGGHRETSNTMTYGQKHEIVVLIPDYFSRQIRPASSRAIAYKFLLKFTKGVEVQVRVYLKRAGPRIIRKSVKSF